MKMSLVVRNLRSHFPRGFLDYFRRSFYSCVVETFPCAFQFVPVWLKPVVLARSSGTRSLLSLRSRPPSPFWPARLQLTLILACD